MSRIPPKVYCAECGCDLGRSWHPYALCKGCGQMNLTERQLELAKCECDSEKGKWNEECPIHNHDPFDIPY